MPGPVVVDTSLFDVLAKQHGFAVVFPTGAFTNTITACSWNANKEAGVDDVQFVRGIIEDVASRANSDRSRIYTSGMSGGGRVSSLLANRLIACHSMSLSIDGATATELRKLISIRLIMTAIPGRGLTLVT